MLKFDEYTEIVDLVSEYGKSRDAEGFNYGKSVDEYIKASKKSMELFEKVCDKVMALQVGFCEMKDKVERLDKKEADKSL